MRLPRKFSQNARKTFYFIHLWTGLILGLWFVVIGLTGSALAFRSEFTSLETRWRVGAPALGPNEKVIPPSQAIKAFKAAYPKLHPERTLYIPTSKIEYRYYRVNARGELNGKTSALIYLLNPVTGQVYPPISRDSMWMPWFEHLHAYLLVPVTGGIANGVLSLFAVFMLLSGLWLWWPSNWKQFKMRIAIKRGVSLRRTLYDLHNATGIYLYGLLLLLSVTAVVLVLDDQTDSGIAKAIDRRMGVVAPKTKATRSVSGGKMPIVTPVGEPLGVDEMVEKAKAAVPNKTLVTIKLPQKSDQPFQASFDPVGFNNGLVFFNPYTGEKMEFDGPTHTPGNWAMKVAGNLHYGWFGGTISQLIYFISGFLPLALFVTGTWMWLNKKRSQNRAKNKRTSVPTKTPETAPTT